MNQNTVIDSYEKIRKMLVEMNFRNIDEEFIGGKFIRSRWISNSRLLVVTNINENIFDAGVTLRFTDETNIKCNTFSPEKYIENMEKKILI